MSSLGRLRRKAEARFRRQTGGNMLVHLFEAGERIQGRPHADLIARTIADFYRMPSGAWFCCKGDWGRVPAAFLIAHAAVRPTGAALAVACSKCSGREDHLEALSVAAEATLQRFAPGGRFEPLPVDTS